MENFVTILTAAVFIEAIVETVKWAVAPDENIDARGRIIRVASIVAGITIAVLYGVDALAAVGLEGNFPYIGEVMTGIIMGRGAPAIHDLLKYINQLAGAEG